MRKRIIAAIVALPLALAINSRVDSLETDTHKAINEKISKTTFNSFSFGAYLKSQLGVENGVEEYFNKNRVWEWLRDGGLFEDLPPETAPYVRSANHFHNPLASSLDKAGFSGIWGTGFIKGVSAIVWSQKDVGTQDPGGYYSWKDARNYFFNALTSADRDARTANFADTFRGVGQLMHLVQDMSVPEHTRNDGHYLPAYEAWVLETQNSQDYQRRAIFDNALASPLFPSTSALSQASVFGNAAPVPIANLFDTKQYNGTNPQATLNQNVGLAEYTNANFVSADSRFKDFPYPSKSTSVTTVYLDIPDPLNPGGTVRRQYYKKVADGDTGYILSGVDYLWLSRKAHLSDAVSGQLDEMAIPPMDGIVFKDYAQKLLPRAVGYSAGLLNYFFRGQLNLLATDTAGQYVITNDSDEEINGDFTVHYDKKPDGNRSLLTGLSGTIPAHGQSAALQLDPPTDAEKPGKFMLAFQGTMGNESGAVAGRAVDLCSQADPITVTGPDAPVDGDQYIAAGGFGRQYTWEISAGSITQDGHVTVSGQCGAATITATDACGNKGTKEVRMQRGMWVEINYEQATFTFSSPSPDIGGCYGCSTPYGNSCTVVDGANRVDYGAAGAADMEGYPVCASSLGSPPCMPTSYYGCKLFTSQKRTYEWRCQ
jgi:hypothetical protein